MFNRVPNKASVTVAMSETSEGSSKRFRRAFSSDDMTGGLAYLVHKSPGATFICDLLR